VTEGGADSELRPFSVACDRCGTVLVGQIRREEAGKMVVVQLPHLDRGGRPCSGRGRGTPVWPLRLELRAVGDGFELMVGGGGPIEFARRENLEAALRDFGVMGDGAQRRVTAVESGKPVVFDVPERRRQPRRGTDRS
jgi:hypothetical protein